jgi:RNA polymerase sigma factor (sigma-70 family)
LVRIRDATDEEAWRTFVAIYAPVVYGYARRQGLQDADAAELTQEVMIEVARAIRSFEYQPERGRFRDWLKTITRRRLLRFDQKQARSPEQQCDAEALERIPDHRADPDWDSPGWTRSAVQHRLTGRSKRGGSADSGPAAPRRFQANAESDNDQSSTLRVVRGARGGPNGGPLGLGSSRLAPY